jgi:hypothetical protein
VEEAFFVGGVPLGRLKEWLGEPISPTSGGYGYQPVSVRVAHVNEGTPRDVRSNADELVAWDCIGYEQTYRAIHEIASHASPAHQDMISQALSISAEMHLITHCFAQRVGEERWVMQHVCVKHISETSS